MLAKHALSQLSYGPIGLLIKEQTTRLNEVVGLGRLELPTSRLSSARSNQLSYKPNDRPRPFPSGISKWNARGTGSSMKKEK